MDHAALPHVIQEHQIVVASFLFSFVVVVVKFVAVAVPIVFCSTGKDLVVSSSMVLCFHLNNIVNDAIGLLPLFQWCIYPWVDWILLDCAMHHACHFSLSCNHVALL